MKFLITALALIIFLSPLSAQNVAIVKAEDLQYLNAIERTFFSMPYLENNPFVGFLALYDLQETEIQSVENVFNTKMDAIKKIKPAKTEEKYVKQIHDFIRVNFLEEYVSESSLADAIENNQFNYVSACVIYALTFDALNIPYRLVETPLHIRIVVHPNTHPILIEPMDPKGELNNISKEFKANYIDQLFANNFINKAQQMMGGDALFNDFYFTTNYVDLKKLTGTEYFNLGVSEFQRANYLAAINTFKKSYLLYPSSKSLEMLTSSCVSYLADCKYKDLVDVELLAFLPSLQSPNIGKEDISGEFARLLSLTLVERDDSAYAKAAYDIMVQTIKDPVIIEEISFFYHYERGRMLCTRGNFREAIPFVSKAFGIRPENRDAENLMTQMLANYLVINISQNRENIDLLEHTFDSYSKLHENVNLKRLLMLLYLKEMADAFDAREENRGLKAKNRFEELTKSNLYSVNEYEISTAYSKGILYYFRKGNYTAAKNLVNDGLRLAPNNSELLMRKRMIISSMN
jgi:tetratricopeptide (TPR) repeat protein